MLIKLTRRATEFSLKYEGPEALVAKAEQEIGRLEADDQRHTSKWIISFFSWHGIDNMSLFKSRRHQAVVVDTVDDDDDTLSLPLG